MLNGQPTLINGACVHHDNGGIDESFDGWYAEKSKYDYHMVIDSCYQQDIAAMVLRGLR